MISFEKVFQTYNNHKLIGIESFWYPSKGWKPFIDTQNLGFTIEQHLELAFKEGCKHFDLVLQNNSSGNAVFADFAATGLIKPDPLP